MEKEFELEYNPSNWVLRVPPSEAVSQHIDIVTQASTTAREKVPHTLNIRYGKSEGQLFDLYGTDLPKGSPIFVYLHGGYWQMLNKDISAYPVIPLWNAGVRCIIADYDLSPKVTVEMIVQEAKELAMFIFNMAKEENCRNIWFGGHSAGAHLCASLLQADWFNLLRPELRQCFSGVVLVSGVFDLTPLINTAMNKALQLNRPTAIQLSPMFKLEKLQSEKEIKAMVVVAEHDPPAFHGQAKAYSEVLKRKNLKTTLKEIPGEDTDHFSIVTNLQISTNFLTRDIIQLIQSSMSI